ncbi:RAMP superfamily CRISPR-associated protein [Saprospira sp. CCB-QB6]|uniref:RAMP superfamily CRISPR-associated protein n=1 Tax=Saprospira sp. CCB-QB6 TaxID=3023936 RepID=UPI0023497923|nr:RAMP superfamily CRISPR-associated protein [Saprospira sp. CCB-QB6]WCL81797.1 RAMP superfamily CRISPR-associated protein [Saprospira sp. CCB-QB6]
MENIKYQIEFFSDWHIGSGLSIAGDVNAAVLKDDNDLPYIPGKTLKGMFRDAAEQLVELKEENSAEHAAWQFFIKEVFGERVEAGGHEGAAGQCFFSSATLSSNLQELFEQEPSLKEGLYRSITATAISYETGVAKEHSLRKLEVCAPMVLEGEIEGEILAKHKDKLECCSKMIKQMGLSRHRGLGRVQFSFTK